ncbi:LicD family protein [Selenomonas ruminantium]|uniref:Lipopolysaccharide cholinephosphotransferase n=1 Tax=Selenomonas ruminantium TaxID=971 RepID=A0A1I0YFI5_SELRU|nr:LicD family protein [Selenomonas ruminantium]SFB11961.1 lipopolysaccharide cholinephosphotransferase [Selenomonas ruminantium]
MELRDDFFEPEVVGDIYVSRALKEVWAINLDLLEVFQQFCENYKLRFYMGFGTLLGAVRHQGFIPWDDDVDILMPRADFERLKKLGSAFAAPYFLQSSYSERGFWYGGMMKFRRSDTTCLERYDYENRQGNHGIGLEIMALDAVPDLPMYQRRQAEEIGRYQRLLWAKGHEEELYKLRGNTEAMSVEEWQQVKQSTVMCRQEELESGFLTVCQQCNTKLSQKLAIFLFYNKGDKYRMFERSWFDETIMLDFAGLLLPAPKGFWQCLRRFYGDGFMGYELYAKRKPHHPAVWDTHVSYTVWQKRILDLYQPDGRKVIVFGTGNMGGRFLEQLAGRLEIFAFVDNNSKTWQTNFKGYPVKSPGILTVEPEKWHVIIANGYYREIGRQLARMGINDYYVYVDEWQALFTTPAERYGENTGHIAKKYRVAGMYVSSKAINADVVKEIRKLRNDSEYLIAFCPRESNDLVLCLRELRSVDRVVITDWSSDVLQERYYCDVLRRV